MNPWTNACATANSKIRNRLRALLFLLLPHRSFIVLNQHANRLVVALKRHVHIAEIVFEAAGLSKAAVFTCADKFTTVFLDLLGMLHAKPGRRAFFGSLRFDLTVADFAKPALCGHPRLSYVDRCL